MSTKTYPLFCMGNPLLDMQVSNGEHLLEKYNIKANDAILAGPEHASLYEDILKSGKVTYVAGGAAQNAARGAAYVLPAESVVYAGCVGDDELADKLREANAKEGVHSAYMVKKGAETGACGVVITGHHRSLVTTLRAAEMFDVEHLRSPEISALVDGATHYYIGGFFLTHGIESALEVAKKATVAGNKTVAMNLSAPFICQFFKVQLEQILPYVDIIIGNESEAEAYASSFGLPDPKDHAATAKAIAAGKKANPAKPRLVVITQGPDPTLVVDSSAPEDVKSYPVQRLSDDAIVDTNGAGDAFAGGFIGAIVAGKSLEESVVAGQKMGAMNIQQIGPQYKYPKEQIL